jgi:hypothetical protein
VDLGPWLCVDSFLACLAIGLLSPPPVGAWRLAAAFGAWDAAATAAGALVPGPALEPAWLACAALLGALAPRGRKALHVAPALLGFDNLLGGLPASMAPAVGVASFAAACAGLTLGRLTAARTAAAA